MHQISSTSTKWQPDQNDNGVILVVDDDEAWVDACCATLADLGYQTVRALTIPEAFAQLGNNDVLTVIVDYKMPGGDGISLIYALTGRSAVRRRKIFFILATAYPSLDVAVGAIRASVVDLLEKPFTAEALNATLLRICSMAAEASPVDSVASQLRAMSSEMQRITALFETNTSTKETGGYHYGHNDIEVDAALVKKLIRAEHSRSRVIGGKLLGDPAWNILLDLLLATLERRKVAVSSACIVAGVAPTTALRLVNRMVDDGVLLRMPDENDGRRDFLKIRPDVQAALISYLLDLSRL